MSMSHKAFAFDWERFNVEFASMLQTAIDSRDPSEICGFIDQMRPTLTDPYQGNPLPADWRSTLEVGDVQEFGDFAITRYYDVKQDGGVGTDWPTLSNTLTDNQAVAMLGVPFGRGDRLFDPGRQGSYFQSPETVRHSKAAISVLKLDAIQPFQHLLAHCCVHNFGMYVTF